MARKPAWKPMDEFPGPPDWARVHRAAVIAQATGCTVKEATALVASLPLRKSDFYGSSVEFEEWLRDNRAGLVVPEREVVSLSGVLGWTPEHEDSHAAMCASCLTVIRPVPVAPGCGSVIERGIPQPAQAVHRIGPPEEPMRLASCPKCAWAIARGSRLCCPKCQASGHDAKLARQRQIAGLPPAEPPKPRRRPKVYRPGKPVLVRPESKEARRWRDLASPRTKVSPLPRKRRTA